jgi:hypothetical protein
MFIKKVTLENFWGFSCAYEVDLLPFSVLVGPNNGGKTTILRAIEFALNAFRLYFGDGHEPNLSGLGNNPWQIGLLQIAERLATSDLHQFFHGRSRQNEASVRLDFEAATTLQLKVSCVSSSDYVRVFMLLDDKQRNDNDPETRQYVNQIFALGAQMIPPLGTLSPSEQSLSWPALNSQLAQGRYAETWRNQLHWLNEGEPPERFQRVAEALSSYLGGVRILPPRRTRGNPPHVLVEYDEQGVRHDVSAAGGGLRTLVSLCAATELSPSRVLLFDEPEAHLHSSLQRRVAKLLLGVATPERQVIVSTHAPDFIDEVPVTSLLWVDRAEGRARSCDDVGKTLVSLGAVSNAQAMRTLGADVVAFFEDSPDRDVLTALMLRCDKGKLAERIKPSLLKGFGNAKGIPGALRILKTLIPMKVAVTAILDADYTQTEPKLHFEDLGDAVIFRLPCKEFENLFLLSGETAHKAAALAASARADHSGESVAVPSQAEIEKKIDELTERSQISAGD